jgi:outer membrane protein assembly factor BamB
VVGAAASLWSNVGVARPRHDVPEVLVELEDASARPAAGLASSRSRRSRAVAVGVAAAVGVAVLLGGVLGRDGDELSGFPRIPSSPTARWATELDTAIVSSVVATDDTVVAAMGWDTTVVGLDRRTGDERWRRAVADESAAFIESVGDVVVVMAWDGEAPALTAIDAADGAQLWARTLTDDEVALPHRLGVLVSTLDPTAPGVELVDARTGRTAATAAGQLVGAQPDGVLVASGDRLDLLDWRTLRALERVDLTAKGERLGPVVAMARLVPSAAVGNDLVVLSSFQSPVTVFAVHDDQLSRRWDTRAWMIAANLTAEDPVVLVQLTSPRRFGERYEVLDARSGKRVWPAADASAPGDVVLGANGFVVVDGLESADWRVVSGHRLDGSRMWRFGLEPFTDVVAVDGAVVAIRTDVVTGTTRLTMYA